MFWKLKNKNLRLFIKTWLKNYFLTPFGVSFILSLFLVLFYGLFFNSFAVKAQSFPPRSPQLSPTLQGQLQQGNTISLDNRKFPVAWIQWTENNVVHTGVSDTGAMQVFGLELLSTNQPTNQAIAWFSGESTSVKVKLIPPYRYLDLTDFLQNSGGQFQASGDTLLMNSPITEITSIREGKQAWGKRVVLELTRPTFWQISQAPTEGVVMLNSKAQASLGKQFFPLATDKNITKPKDEDDLGGGTGNASFRVENNGSNSKIIFSLPTANKLQVSSLNNPARLVIDVRADAPTEKKIAWADGITWQQQFIRLGKDIFPVTWLEIDAKSPKISLKPIATNLNGLQGTGSVVNIANLWQASAVINGGFFNRNTKQPLGAIRQEGRWLSGPILNRGAIAWDNQGKIKVGRLSLQEVVTTSTGQKLIISQLNSGYVQKGLARYTSAWGQSYTPATDNEAIAIVQNNQVISQQSGGKSGQIPFNIPTDGYLLAFRGGAISTNSLSVGTQVNLASNTIPADFNQYANILGAGPLMIENGRIVLDSASEKFNKGFQQQNASRSAIAVHQNGKFLMIAVHNRVGGKGPTLTEMAALLKQLGAKEALNLDGGSSTALSLGGQLIDRSAVTAARVHNGLGVFVSP
jgi:exopolysaccharide biosynthesis protein